jgi:CRISPR-associated protein Csd2
LKQRVDGELTDVIRKDENRYREEACKKWIDVRAFGQVFAYKAEGKKKKTDSEEGEDQGSNTGISIGIRGPVSIHSAFSVVPVSVSSIQITKSVSGEGDGAKKASDTMGMKHRVDHGVYVFYGAINPQLAEKTGFSDSDAEAIKNSLVNLFQNDSSSARPEGSMEVNKVYWWKHNNKIGQYSSAVVHRSLTVAPNKPESELKSIEDYLVENTALEGLKPEILNGL